MAMDPAQHLRPLRTFSREGSPCSAFAHLSSRNRQFTLDASTNWDDPKDSQQQLTHRRKPFFFRWGRVYPSVWLVGDCADGTTMWDTERVIHPAQTPIRPRGVVCPLASRGSETYFGRAG